MESRPPEPREEVTEPQDIPQPTQARADFIKDRVHTGDPGPVVAPRNVDVPYLGGEGTVGATLNCTMGNWDGEPTSYAYQWKRGTTDIAATGDTYIVTAQDAGASITCIVTATNDAGSTAAPPSNAVAIAAAAATDTETRRK